MFEKAVRMKLRFDYKGSLSVEELWDLSVQELDSIYKTLNTKLKTSNEDSLLASGKKTKETAELELKVELVKHIVAIKLDEQAAKKKTADNKAKKQKLLEVLERKQNQAVENMSEDDIKKLIDEIGD